MSDSRRRFPRRWIGALFVCLTCVSTARAERVESLDLADIRTAIARGQDSLAETELTLLLATPLSAEREATARLLRAGIRHRSGDVAGALNDVRAVRRLSAGLDLERDAAYLEAELLYRAGRYAESAEAFEAFVRHSPSDPRRTDARWYRAEALARSDRCDEATVLYNALLHEATTSLVRQRAHYGRAWCRRAYEDEAGAHADFGEAEAGPDAELSVRAAIECGIASFRLSRPDEALAWLDRAAPRAHGADSLRVAGIRGQILFATGRTEEARPLLEAAMATAPLETHAAFAYRVGWARLEDRNAMGALAAFERVLDDGVASDSLRLGAEYGIGVARVSLGRLAEAIEPFSTVRSRAAGPLAARATYALAYVYHQLGNVGASSEAMAELKRRFPQSPILDQAMLLEGENLFQEERYAEAIGAYETQLSGEDTERGDALFRVAIAHVKLMEWEAAERRLNELLLRYPKSPHRADARFWLGEALYRRQKYADARRAYEAARLGREDPALMHQAQYGLAWCDYATGDYEAAASGFGRLLDAPSPDPIGVDDLLLRRGNCFYNLRRFEDAARDYERLLAAHPGSAVADQALYQKAWSLHRLGRFEQAHVSFEEVDRRFPDSPWVAPALYWSGYSLFRDKQYESAATRFSRVAGLPDVPDSLRVQSRLRVAECHFNRKDYARAAAVYEALLGAAQPEPVRREAYEGWIESLESAGRHEDAIQAAGRLAQAFPESESSGEALYRIAIKQLDAGRTMEGVASLQKFLAVGKPVGHVVDANRRAAQASLELGDKLRAAEYFRNAAYHGDRDDGIQYRFEAGRLFFELGKNELAREEFRRVLRLKPDPETRRLAQYNYGLALEQLGRKRDAENAFEEIVADSGTPKQLRAEALLAAGLLARERKDTTRARTAVCEAATLGTGATGAEAQYWCAETDFEAKAYDDAIGGYQRVVSAFPNEREWTISAHYRMAECFEQLKRWVEAREQYQRIVNVTSDAAWVADAEERLKWIQENPWVFEQTPEGNPSRWSR